MYVICKVLKAWWACENFFLPETAISASCFYSRGNWESQSISQASEYLRIMSAYWIIRHFSISWQKMLVTDLFMFVICFISSKLLHVHYFSLINFEKWESDYKCQLGSLCSSSGLSWYLKAFFIGTLVVKVRVETLTHV